MKINIDLSLQGKTKKKRADSGRITEVWPTMLQEDEPEFPSIVMSFFDGGTTVEKITPIQWDNGYTGGSFRVSGDKRSSFKSGTYFRLYCHVFGEDSEHMEYALTLDSVYDQTGDTTQINYTVDNAIYVATDPRLEPYIDLPGICGDPVSKQINEKDPNQYCGGAEHPIKITYKQEIYGNEHEIEPEIWSDTWDNENEDRLKRKPIKFVTSRDSHKRWNGGGNGSINPRVKMKSGDNIRFDISPDLQADGKKTGPCRIEANGDGKNPAKIRFQSTIGQYGIAFGEVGTKTIAHYITRTADMPYYETTPGEIQYQSDWIEPFGFLFHPFDTLDDVNFKVTAAPSFNANALSGSFDFGPLPNVKVNVYLIPRRWLYYLRHRNVVPFVSENVFVWSTTIRLGVFGGTSADLSACDIDSVDPWPPCPPDASKFVPSVCWGVCPGTGFSTYDCGGNMIDCSGGGPAIYEGYNSNLHWDDELGCVDDIILVYPSNTTEGRVFTYTWAEPTAHHEFHDVVALWYDRPPNDFSLSNMCPSNPEAAFNFQHFYEFRPEEYICEKHDFKIFQMVGDEYYDFALQNEVDADGDVDNIVGGFNSIHIHNSTPAIDRPVWFVSDFFDHQLIHFRSLGDLKVFQTYDVNTVPIYCNANWYKSSRADGSLKLWEHIEESLFWKDFEWARPPLPRDVGDDYYLTHFTEDTAMRVNGHLVTDFPFGVGLCPGQPGELVAVLEIAGSFKYVWRKLDETSEENPNRFQIKSREDIDYANLHPWHSNYSIGFEESIGEYYFDDWGSAVAPHYDGRGNLRAPLGRFVGSGRRVDGLVWMEPDFQCQSASGSLPYQGPGTGPDLSSWEEDPLCDPKRHYASATQYERVFEGLESGSYTLPVPAYVMMAKERAVSGHTTHRVLTYIDQSEWEFDFANAL